jgi:hypothetical protein
MKPVSDSIFQQPFPAPLRQLGHASAISRRNAPEVFWNFSRQEIRGRRECRMPNAPAASYAIGRVEHTSVVTTGSPESNRHSLRNGFTAYSVVAPVYRAF